MIQFHTISLMPPMFQALNYGVVGQAIQSGMISLQHWHIRDYADQLNGYIDDKPYGGQPGMVIQAAPLTRTLQAVQQSIGSKPPVYLMAAHGTPLSQTKLDLMAEQTEPFIFICGRYDGIDQRFIDHHVTEMLSIGDYILTGGELPCMVCIDSVSRLIPGVLGNRKVLEKESFRKKRLSAPVYTRPRHYLGDVPKVLLQGDPAAIQRWQDEAEKKATQALRPDLLEE